MLAWFFRAWTSIAKIFQGGGGWGPDPMPPLDPRKACVHVQIVNGHVLKLPHISYQRRLRGAYTSPQSRLTTPLSHTKVARTDTLEHTYMSLYIRCHYIRHVYRSGATLRYACLYSATLIRHACWVHLFR